MKPPYERQTFDKTAEAALKRLSGLEDDIHRHTAEASRMACAQAVHIAEASRLWEQHSVLADELGRLIPPDETDGEASAPMMGKTPQSPMGAAMSAPALPERRYSILHPFPGYATMTPLD